MNICVVLPVTLALTGASFAVALARNNVPTTDSALSSTHELRFQLARSGSAQNAVSAVRPAYSFSPSSAGTRLWVGANAAIPKTNSWSYLQPPRGLATPPNGNAPDAPSPGVYESEPYKCIVVVPGPQWDDRSLVDRGDPSARMPEHKPELRLVPRRK